MVGRSVAFASCCITAFAWLSLGAQTESLSNASGPIDRSSGLTCPLNTYIIGVIGQPVLPIAIECSAYGPDGQRAGGVVRQEYPKDKVLATPVGPLIQFEHDLIHPPQTARCAGDQVVAAFRTRVDTGSLSRVDVVCATIAADGGGTALTTAGSLARDRAGPPTLQLTCPAGKFAHGYVGDLRGIALLCLDTPTLASSVTGIGMSTHQTVAGAAVSGTVVLNAPAAPSTTVRLSIVGVPTATVPPLVDVRAGSREASFVTQSSPSAAGCATITATLGRSTATAPLMITPPPPAGAPFSFLLLPESPSNVFGAPSTITAMIVLPPSKTFVAGGVTRGQSVAVESDNPGIVAVQSTTQRSSGDTVKVSLSALATGCAVVTATVDGVAWKKTVRVAAGF